MEKVPGIDFFVVVGKYIESLVSYTPSKLTVVFQITHQYIYPFIYFTYVKDRIFIAGGHAYYGVRIADVPKWFLPCHESCKPEKCNNNFPSGKFDCTECNTGLPLRGDGTCPCDPALGQYEDLTGNCIKCSLPCLTCKPNSTDCATCSENFELKADGSCFCDETKGNILIGSKCIQCKSQCKTCLKVTNFCTECVNDFLPQGMKDGTCSCDLASKRFVGTQNVSCTRCQEPCLTCQNSSGSCLSCIEGYYL